MGKVRVQRSTARVTTKLAAFPLLRDGDRMDTAEFMRRYEATPEGFRAELINGVVYVNRWIETGPDGKERVMPPISGGGQGHSRPGVVIAGALANYWAATPGTEANSPATLILSPTDSTPEPDGLLQILPESGGRSHLGEDGYFHGPPELIVEVAKSTVTYDLGPKLEMYQRNGVQEYIVWRVRHRVIDWFYLNRRGEYVLFTPGTDGILKSRVFPGLWLDPVAMMGGDMAHVLAVVQQGIASPEHAAFVEKLRKRAAKKKR